MKKRILLTAGFIGILLVSALAFSGCDIDKWFDDTFGIPEGKVTVTNKTTTDNYTSVDIKITTKEGGEEVGSGDVDQGKSVSFTLPPGDYIIRAYHWLAGETDSIDCPL